MNRNYLKIFEIRKETILCLFWYKNMVLLDIFQQILDDIRYFHRVLYKVFYSRLSPLKYEKDFLQVLLKLPQRSSNKFFIFCDE